MNFHTRISKTEQGKHLIRGYDMLDLMQKHSFAEMMILLWRGDLPTEKEVKLLHTALAAGALAIGENHGGAAEKCAYLLQSGKSAQEISEQSMIPGFGHKIYKEEDPRATVIYNMAKELGFSCKSFELAYEIESVLSEKKGKKIPLNIDGAIAAAMIELKLDWRLGKALFLIPRLVGAAAHVLEEYEQNNSYHRLGEGDVSHEE